MAVQTKRLVKGTPLTAQEHDDNLDFFNDRIAVLEGAAGALASQISCLPLGGLSYSVQVTDLPLSGVVVSGGPITITLAAANDTHPRTDRIVIDINGNISKKTGTPGESAAPPDYDPATEYVIRDIFVDKDATEGSDLGGGGIGTEEVWTDAAVNNWTFASNTAQITQKADTSMSGTHLIEGVPLAVGEEFSLTNSGNKQVSSYDSIIFDLNAGASHGEIIIYAYADGRVPYTGTVTITNGQYNYSDTNPGISQIINVPFSAFGFQTADFNKIVIKHPSASNTWKMDNIRLGTGTSVNDFVLEANSVGAEHLKPSLKAVATITEVIDWSAGVTLKYAATNGANVVFTESNVVGSGESKTITIEITGTPNSITFPARFKKAVNTSEDYDGAYRNIYVLEDNSTNVMYANTLFNV